MKLEIRYDDQRWLKHHLTAELNILVPFDNLLESVVVAVVAGEAVGVDEGSERVATLISTVGVHLTTIISCRDINVRLVNGTGWQERHMSKQSTTRD